MLLKRQPLVIPKRYISVPMLHTHVTWIINLVINLKYESNWRKQLFKYNKGGIRTDCLNIIFSSVNIEINSNILMEGMMRLIIFSRTIIYRSTSNKFCHSIEESVILFLPLFFYRNRLNWFIDTFTCIPFKRFFSPTSDEIFQLHLWVLYEQIKCIQCACMFMCIQEIAFNEWVHWIGLLVFIFYYFVAICYVRFISAVISSENDHDRDDDEDAAYNFASTLNLPYSIIAINYFTNEKISKTKTFTQTDTHSHKYIIIL